MLAALLDASALLISPLAERPPVETLPPALACAVLFEVLAALLPELDAAVVVLLTAPLAAFSVVLAALLAAPVTGVAEGVVTKLFAFISVPTELARPKLSLPVAPMLLLALLAPAPRPPPRPPPKGGGKGRRCDDNCAAQQGGEAGIVEGALHDISPEMGPRTRPQGPALVVAPGMKRHRRGLVPIGKRFPSVKNPRRVWERLWRPGRLRTVRPCF